MKKNAQYLLQSLTAMPFCYLIWTFIEADFNIAGWSYWSRMTCATAAFMLSGLIMLMLKEEYK